MKTSFFQLLDSLKFAGISSQLLTILYFWGQTTTIFSLFSVVSDQIGLTSYFLTNLCLLNTPFLFYRLSMLTEKFMGIDLLFIASLLLTALLAVFISLLYVATRRYRLKIDKQQGNIEKVLKIVVYFFLVASISLAGMSSYEVYLLVQQQKEYLMIIPLLNLVLLIVIVYVSEETTCQVKFTRRLSLSRLYSHGHSIRQLVRMGLNAIMIPGLVMPKVVPILMLVVLAAINMQQIREIILQKGYFEASTTTMFVISASSSLTTKLLLLLCSIVSNTLVMNNFMIIALTIITLLVVSIKRAKSYRQKQLVQLKPQQLTEEHDAVLYMFELVELLRDQSNRKQQATIISLVAIHSRECRDQNCFCKKYVLDKQKSLLQDREYLLRFVEDKLENVYRLFQNSIMITLIFVSYKLEFMKAYSKAFYLVAKTVNKVTHMTWVNEYLVLQLQSKVKVEASRAHLNSEQLQIENFFEGEEFKLEMLAVQSKITSLFIEKYRKLNMDFCSLNLIERITDQTSQQLRVIHQLWLKFKKQDSYDVKSYELWLIYFDLTLASRKQTLEIVSVITNKAQTLKHLRGFTKKIMEKISYTDKGCVIESEVLPEKMGIVSNISNSCQHFFRVNKLQVIGKDIHNFFPEFFSHPHRKMLNQWVNEETSAGHIGKIKEIYFVNSFCETFRGAIYLKVHPSLFGIKLYVLVAKQNENDFLILNDKEEIEGFGKKLGTLFNQNSFKRIFSYFAEESLRDIIKRKQKVKKQLPIYSQAQKESRVQTKILEFINSSSQIIKQSTSKDKRVVYDCQIEVRRQTIGQSQYYAVQFLQVRLRRVSEKTALGRQRNSIILDQMQHKLAELAMITTKTCDLNTIKSLQSKEDSSNKNIFERENVSTIAQSIRDESSVQFEKLYVEVQDKALFLGRLRYPKYSTTSWQALLVSLIIILAMIGQYSLFRSGMTSVNNVIFADGSVSDNNQLLEMIYNQVLTSRSYCFSQQVYDISRCEYLLKSGEFIGQVVWTLFTDNFYVHNFNVSLLSNTKYYAYYEQPVSINLNGTAQNVSVQQFNFYYFYNLQQIIELTNSTTKDLQKLAQCFRFLFDNWGSMKYVNHGAIYYYQDVAFAQIESLKVYLIVSIIFFIALAVVFIVVLKRYYDQFESKREAVIKLNNYITHQCSQSQRRYFDKVHECVSQQTYRSLQRVTMESNENKRNNTLSFQPQRRHNWLLSILFCLLTVANICSLVFMLQLFPPARDMIVLINQLMDTQNYLFQNYFQLKTFYLAYNFSKPAHQIQQQILVHLNQTNNIFLTYSKQSINIYTSQDDTFSADFTSLLIDDVCTLTASLFAPWQVEKCKEKMHYQILQKGLLNGMNLFQRQVYQALLELRMNQNINATAYFKQAVYEDIDDYLIYMFRLYQATQARLVQGLNTSIDRTVGVSSKLLLVQGAILVIILFHWFYKMDAEMLKISNLYSQVLQFPKAIVKDNKNIMTTIRRIFMLKG